MQMRATVTKTYRCGWKCVHCHTVHTEAGHQINSAKSSMGFTRQQAQERAAIAAQNHSQRAMDKLVRNVNEHRSFLQLHVKGKCPSCGTRQPWSLSIMPRLLSFVPLVAAVLSLLTPHGKPLAHRLTFSILRLPLLRELTWLRRLGDVIYIVPGILLILLTVLLWLLIGWLQNRIALSRLEAEGDPHCYPLVVEPPLPEGIGMDDPRVQAVVNTIAAGNASFPSA